MTVLLLVLIALGWGIYKGVKNKEGAPVEVQPEEARTTDDEQPKAQEEKNKGRRKK